MNNLFFSHDAIETSAGYFRHRLSLVVAYTSARHQTVLFSFMYVINQLLSRCYEMGWGVKGNDSDERDDDG